MRVKLFHSKDEEIARWSEPLVADHIYGAYEHWLGGKCDGSEELGRRHCRLWRNLLSGDIQRARQTRGDLLKHARLADAGEEILEAIDAAVLSELLHVILRRSQSALEESRVDGMALMQAASALGGIRSAA
jgi:hypothetical protein